MRETAWCWVRRSRTSKRVVHDYAGYCTSGWPDFSEHAISNQNEYALYTRRRHGVEQRHCSVHTRGNVWRLKDVSYGRKAVTLSSWALDPLSLSFPFLRLLRLAGSPWVGGETYSGFPLTRLAHGRAGSMLPRAKFISIEGGGIRVIAASSSSVSEREAGLEDAGVDV